VDDVRFMLTRRERALLDTMRAIAGVRTDAEVVRVALYRLAEHFQIDGLAIDDFAVEERPRRPVTRR